MLDKKTETILLTQEEIDIRVYSRNRLSTLLREEEIKWFQRAKTKDILEGDSNTKYFHLVANGKHRKTRIFQLQDGDQLIRGDANLKLHITTYYKGLFGPPDDFDLQVYESKIDDIPQVSQLENEALTQEFTENEIKRQFSKWNTTRLRVLMDFQLSFTKCFGMLLKPTC